MELAARSRATRNCCRWYGTTANREKPAAAQIFAVGHGTAWIAEVAAGLHPGRRYKTGLTSGLSRALASPRMLVHDRGRVLADLACSIADGARVVSDFRVMGDQRELFGPVASVPTAWRTLAEIARGGTRAEARITAAPAALPGPDGTSANHRRPADRIRRAGLIIAVRRDR